MKQKSRKSYPTENVETDGTKAEQIITNLKLN